MGNPKTSTKVRPIVPEKSVQGYISNVLQDGKMRKFCGIGDAREVGFHEIWVWEERPTYSDPHYTKVTFHGRTHVSSGWARYEGKFGTWVIDLASEGQSTACTRTWGRPYCTHPSDEWCETPEQRRQRLTQLFEQYPMTERENERWSWDKIS